MVCDSSGSEQTEGEESNSLINLSSLTGESLLEKERRLSEMILQLQMVREQLLSQQEQQSKVCSKFYYSIETLLLERFLICRISPLQAVGRSLDVGNLELPWGRIFVTSLVVAWPEMTPTTAIAHLVVIQPLFSTWFNPCGLPFNVVKMTWSRRAHIKRMGLPRGIKGSNCFHRIVFHIDFLVN